MAEIDIEEKRSTGWIWILGLLLIAALGYWIFEAADNDVAMDEVSESAAEMAVVTDPVVEPVPEVTASPEVLTYMNECAQSQDADFGMGHTYTAGCVDDLVAALTTIGMSGQPSADLQQALTDARTAADSLTASAETAERHANMTANAFNAIAHTVDQMEDDGFGPMNADELNSIAAGIETDQDLLEQRTEIESFFARAGEVLQQATGAATM